MGLERVSVVHLGLELGAMGLCGLGFGWADRDPQLDLHKEGYGESIL